MFLFLLIFIIFSMFLFVIVLHQQHGMTCLQNPRALPCKVIVENLGKWGTQHELEDAFQSYGPLKKVQVLKDPMGFAFIEFMHSRDAQNAVRELDGQIVCGRQIRVKLSDSETRFSHRSSPKYNILECTGAVRILDVKFDEKLEVSSEVNQNVEVKKNLNMRMIDLGISFQRLNINQRNHSSSTSSNYQKPLDQHNRNTTQQLQNSGRPKQLQKSDRSQQLQNHGKFEHQQKSSRPQQPQSSGRSQQLQESCRSQQQLEISRPQQLIRISRSEHLPGIIRSQQCIKYTTQRQCNNLSDSSLPSNSSSISKSNNASDEIKCIICLDTVDNWEMEYIQCGHSFHIKCCSNWLLRNGTCPICRTEVVPSFYNLCYNVELTMRQSIDIMNRLILHVRAINRTINRLQ